MALFSSCYPIEKKCANISKKYVVGQKLFKKILIDYTYQEKIFFYENSFLLIKIVRKLYDNLSIN